MVIADQRSRLPWWHRRVVCVTDDEAWAALAAEKIRELGGWPEILTWSEADSLQGPVGALVANVDVTNPGVEDVLVAWAAAGRQPTTLLWVPPARGAARIKHMLEVLRYPHVFGRAPTKGPERDLTRYLSRILPRGGWIVQWFAAALGWSDEPFLVHVLSLPVLAEERPPTVKAWRRAARILSPAEFVALVRDNGGPYPKDLHSRLVFSEATVWAAEQRVAPTRRDFARHLGFSSGQYMATRAQRLAELTYEDLVVRPVADVLAVLTRPLLRTGVIPPGCFVRASGASPRSS